MATDEDEGAKKRIEAFISGYVKAMPASNFDIPFAKAVKVISAKADIEPDSVARVTFSCAIPAVYVNNPGSGREIHGGAIATFLDATTGAALMASKSYWGPGVTRNMNITYFRPLREGDQVVIEAEVIQIAKRLATIQGVMKRQSDGVVLAMCLHEKFNPDNPGSRAFSL